MTGEKSVALAALLGVFGPLGWLYAGPAREVVPAAVIYYLAFALLPLWVFLPFQGLLTALSVAAGALYAWQHNKNGHATPLFTDDDGRPRLPGRR